MGAMLALLARALGAPLGEPFADDFEFLHHAMFDGAARLLDGGGAKIYWRPLSRQLYFDLFGPLMLAHPRWVAGLHAALLALAVLLLYRALRRRWSGPAAAAAASFPVIAESSRTLLLWPTAFQDLGALLAACLALHEASRRRLPTAVAALLAALLCKEIAVVAALLLPLGPWGLDARARRRFGLAVLLMVAVWGVAYALVMRDAGLLFQRNLEAWRPALPLRFLWALTASLLDALGVGAVPERLGVGLGLALGVGTLGALGSALRTAATRAALRAALPWILWGGAWFLASAATLSEVFPVWGPFRSAFGMLGLGIAAAALFGAAGRIWLALLVGIRLALLIASPGPPSEVSPMPYQPGAAYDFASLARLSRFTAETRAALRVDRATLPRGAVVVWTLRPQMGEHAFAGGKALQVWYRDTTLVSTSWDEVQDDPDRRVDVALEYQAHERRQVVVIAPAALRVYREGLRAMRAQSNARAVADFARADSLQVDRGAKAFLGALAGKRAVCLLTEGELAGARAAAERSLTLWPEAGDARYVLAVLFAIQRRFPEAHAQLDTLLEHYPASASANALRDSLRAHEATR